MTKLVVSQECKDGLTLENLVMQFAIKTDLRRKKWSSNSMLKKAFDNTKHPFTIKGKNPCKVGIEVIS